jgi:uncharacterized protein YeaO (DUF488 family)
MNIQVKRVYEEPSDQDGLRVLVDRLWPRGLSKEKGKIDRWIKELAPSTELRKWYGHDPDKWQDFKLKYFEELGANQELVKQVRNEFGDKNITFLFSSKELKLNNALALKEYIQS